jgi:hypothetical protein
MVPARHHHCCQTLIPFPLARMLGWHFQFPLNVPRYGICATVVQHAEMLVGKVLIVNVAP